MLPHLIFNTLLYLLSRYPPHHNYHLCLPFTMCIPLYFCIQSLSLNISFLQTLPPYTSPLYVYYIIAPHSSTCPFLLKTDIFHEVHLHHCPSFTTFTSSLISNYLSFSSHTFMNSDNILAYTQLVP